MSTNFLSHLRKLSVNTNFLLQTTRYVSTKFVNNSLPAWRYKKGIPMNPTASGILTDRPDYTFLDGRPTPLGMRQKRRMVKERELATKIIELSKEIDFAVERHRNILESKELEKKKILDNKLQQKGYLLLKNKN